MVEDSAFSYKSQRAFELHFQFKSLLNGMILPIVGASLVEGLRTTWLPNIVIIFGKMSKITACQTYFWTLGPTRKK